MTEKTGIVRLLTSSKGLAVLIALALVFVLEILHVDSTRFADFAWKLIVAYIGGTSLQDAAANLATRAPSPSVTVNTTSLIPPPDHG